MAWSNGTDSHDSGIGHSPPFEGGLGGGSVGNGIGASSSSTGNSSAPFKNSFLQSASNSSTNNHEHSNNTLTSGIWGELNKVLGGLDLNGTGTGNSTSSNNHHNEINKQFLNIGSRSSLDLGTLGRPTTLTPPQEVTSSATSTLSSSNMLQNNTANGIGRQMSLPTDHNTTLPGNTSGSTIGNFTVGQKI